jgi:hypothetical protein
MVTFKAKLSCDIIARVTQAKQLSTQLFSYPIECFLQMPEAYPQVEVNWGYPKMALLPLQVTLSLFEFPPLKLLRSGRCLW